MENLEFNLKVITARLSLSKSKLKKYSQQVAKTYDDNGFTPHYFAIVKKIKSEKQLIKTYERQLENIHIELNSFRFGNP